MASQEIVELLLDLDGDEPAEPAESEVSHSIQISRLMRVYAKAIPRLKSKKPPSQSLTTIIGGLDRAVLFSSTQASITEGRSLVCSAADLVESTWIWVSTIAQGDTLETTRCQSILGLFLDSTLEACSNSLGSSIAQRLFQERFPRLTLRSSVRPDWESGEQSIVAAVNASMAIGRSLSEMVLRPRIASLLLVAHSREKLTLQTLAALFPVLLTSLQTNVALDESLAILFTYLFPASAAVPPELSTHITVPLSVVLPALCSSHPNASTRHLSFRLLGQVLHLSPSPLRLQILRDLLSPSEDNFPQMRIAALGLIKDAVIEALNSPPSDEDVAAGVFATPVLLQTIGPLVFRPDPPDLFDTIPTIEEFTDLPEAKRLTECLTLYYILLQLDGNNKTGIRNTDTIRDVEISLLRPLRSALEAWTSVGPESDQTHALFSLAPLEVNLARIDEALKALPV